MTIIDAGRGNLYSEIPSTTLEDMSVFLTASYGNNIKITPSGRVNRRGNYHLTINYWNLSKRKRKHLIKQMESRGAVELDDTPDDPLSRDDKRILINSGIVSGVTFLTTITGIKSFASLGLNEALTVAIIPSVAAAATAFLTKLAEQRGIILADEKSKNTGQ
jgi:hypothetical protein